MARNPGIIQQLKDGRIVIVYNNQPLLVSKQKIVMHLLNEEFKPILNSENKPSTILVSADLYDVERPTRKHIGYAD